MRLAMLGFCLGLASMLGAEEHAAQVEPPKPEQIPGLIKELGSDDFAVREEAEKKLRRAGDEAVQPLKAAAQITQNEELKARASKILEYLTVGRKREQAIQALGSKDWPTVKAGLDELFAELDKGKNIDADLRQAAQGEGSEAKLARELRNQLLALKKLTEIENRTKEARTRSAGSQDLEKEADKVSQELYGMREQIKNGMYDKAHASLSTKSIKEPGEKTPEPSPDEKK